MTYELGLDGSRPEALCSANKLCRRTAPRSIAGRQHSESSVRLLVDADVVGEDGEEVEARFDPAERPLGRSEELDVAEASLEIC